MVHMAIQNHSAKLGTALSSQEQLAELRRAKVIDINAGPDESSAGHGFEHYMTCWVTTGWLVAIR